MLAPADFEALLADKAFDVEWIPGELANQQAQAVPPSAKISSQKSRNLSGFAMRSDKTDQPFTAMIYLTAAVINSR